jgi:hypothetical protein
MSRRTFPRFAVAGLLAATLAAAAAAQPPAPLPVVGPASPALPVAVPPPAPTPQDVILTPINLLDATSPRACPVTAAYDLASKAFRAWEQAASTPASTGTPTPQPPTRDGFELYVEPMPTTVVPTQYVPVTQSGPPCGLSGCLVTGPQYAPAPMPAATRPVVNYTYGVAPQGTITTPRCTTGNPVPQAFNFQYPPVAPQTPAAPPVQPAGCYVPCPESLPTPRTFEFRIDLGHGPEPCPAVSVARQPAPPAGCAAPCCSGRPAALSGTWYREMPGMVTAVTFKGDELKLTMTANSGETTATLTVTADCAVTKDGTVHGVITGIDLDVTGGTDLVGMELVGLSLELQVLVDQPFAFRCRPTDGGLMVSNIRFGCDRDMSMDLAPVRALAGMYKPAGAGGVPTPKPPPVVSVYSSDPAVRIERILDAVPQGRVPILPPVEYSAQPPGAEDPSEFVGQVIGGITDRTTVVGGMTLPSGRYLQHTPQYFPPDVVVPLPLEMPPPPPAPCPGVRVMVAPCPVPPPVAAMMPPPPTVYVQPPLPYQTPVVYPAPQMVCPVPCPVPVRVALPAPPIAYPAPCMPPPPVVYGGPVPIYQAPFPGAVYPLPNTYIGPPPPMPSRTMVRTLQGTWYREIGPVMCVLAVRDEHLTITITVTAEGDEKTLTYGLVLTADYYPTRDGSGMVGLISGVDVVLEGDAAAQAEMLDKLKDLPKLQKCLVGQPFALTFRIHDDTLMLGELRLTVGEDSPITSEEVALIAGRYKAADGNGVPKAKPVKPRDGAKYAPTRSRSCDMPPPPVESKVIEVVPTPTGYCPSASGPVLPPNTPPMIPPTPLPDSGSDVVRLGEQFGIEIGSREPATPVRIHGGIVD